MSTAKNLIRTSQNQSQQTANPSPRSWNSSSIYGFSAYGSNVLRRGWPNGGLAIDHSSWAVNSRRVYAQVAVGIACATRPTSPEQLPNDISNQDRNPTWEGNVYRDSAPGLSSASRTALRTVLMHASFSCITKCPQSHSRKLRTRPSRWFPRGNIPDLFRQIPFPTRTTLSMRLQTPSKWRTSPDDQQTGRTRTAMTETPQTYRRQ